MMAVKRYLGAGGLICLLRYRRLLSTYIDGELDSRVRMKVESHLGLCRSCRTEHENMLFASRTVSALVNETVVSSPPPLNFSSPAVKAVRKSRFKLSLVPVTALTSLVLTAGAIWYYTHPSNLPWKVVVLEGAVRVGSEYIAGEGKITEGDWLETEAGSRARVKVGGIGQVEVDPNTRLQLVQTRLTEHRLSLEHGGLQATIIAPPRLFFVNTPSALAVDLGCAYTLQVDKMGGGLLHVTAGWVAFELGGRESKVPAGGLCATRPGVGPGTPYFDDASQALKNALESFDFGDGGARSLDVILLESRQRDTLTLWHLLSRVSEAERGRVYDRLASFAPPPTSVTREGVLQLDQKMLTRWRESLEQVWLKESMPGLRMIWRWLWS